MPATASEVNLTASRVHSDNNHQLITDTALGSGYRAGGYLPQRLRSGAATGSCRLE